MKVEDVNFLPAGWIRQLRDRLMRPPREQSTFAGAPLARMVDQDLPHRSRGYAEKVRAVLPSHSPLIHQPEVRLVDERGGLERVIRSLPTHIGGSDPAQFRLNGRCEPFLILGGACPPQSEQSGQIVSRTRSTHGVMAEWSQHRSFAPRPPLP